MFITNMDKYYQKYVKYKEKYLFLKKTKKGGGGEEGEEKKQEEIEFKCAGEESSLEYKLDDFELKFGDYTVEPKNNSSGESPVKNIPKTIQQPILFYKNIELMDRGSIYDTGTEDYSFVKLYTSDDGKIQMVIKNTTNQDEAKLVDALYKNNICNLFNAKMMAVYNDRRHTYHYILSHKFDMDLFGLFYENNIDLSDLQKITIVEKMLQDIKCLYDKEFFYNDIKIENIFVKCVNKNYIFKLGDIGSIYKKGVSERNITTYPFIPPPNHKYDIRIFTCNIIWGILCVILSLFWNQQNTKDFDHILHSDNLDKIIDFGKQDYFNDNLTRLGSYFRQVLENISYSGVINDFVIEVIKNLSEYKDSKKILGQKNDDVEKKIAKEYMEKFIAAFDRTKKEIILSQQKN